MDEETWGWIEQERLGLADLLDALTEQQWESRSLCAAWRVRDVAAHLTMTPARAPGVLTMVKALVRTRGDLWGAGRDVAVAYAQRPTTRIVAELRRDAGVRSRPVFVKVDNILLDLLVHGQDIAVPLGIDRTVPRAAGTVALERIWSMGWPFHARRRLAGVALEAADAGWAAGEGPVVQGAAGDLLLLLTGRTDAALGRLDGPGVDVLRRRADAIGAPGPADHSRGAEHDGRRRSS